MRLEEFIINLKIKFEVTTTTLIAEAQARFDSETARIIRELEAAAKAYRVKMEVQIWDNIHVLVANLEIEAENWLKSETIRINLSCQTEIDVLISTSTTQITTVRVEWNLRVEQEINIIKVNAQLEIETERDHWHVWLVN